MPGTGFREFSDGTAIRASGPVLHLVNDFHGAELGSAGDGTARKHRLDDFGKRRIAIDFGRSEEHTSELQSLMWILYAVVCLKKNTVIDSFLVDRPIILLNYLHYFKALISSYTCKPLT